ncbi:tetratricopeptide repeat protein [Actinoallomurus sp. CA-142502]|uniref:tetratricopeptide repeat protein n=1 Tax=Actinoallomurus sp. CA-142502 TaxID=3239885 RepID=UPI003D8A4060
MATESAWERLDAGDVAGAMRSLRLTANELPIGELARVTGRAAEMMGFGDLAEASSALAADPDRPQALYEFGYACIERGAGYLAIPALSAALRLLPEEVAIRAELVVALEREGRHGEAVGLLEERAGTLSPWPYRYLLVFNAILAGDLATARRHADLLPPPEDDQWASAHDKVLRMLARAAVAGPRDDRDLRGWHFVLTGGVLATLSPYGFDQGMTGRYAYTQDDYGRCRHGLERLRLILAAAGTRPATVSLLPDRSSEILGLAAAGMLGVPAVPFAPGRPDTVVVAYDLSEADAAPALRERAPGQVLYEHATCWTTPPAVPADVSGYLHQVSVPPWGETLRRTPDGSVERTPADDRPAEELATEIAGANPEPDPGDGETPADPDEALAEFTRTVAGEWRTGVRHHVASAGPVRSNRFG